MVAAGAKLTPRRGTVTHLGNQGCCVHIYTGNLSAPGVARRRVLIGSVSFVFPPLIQLTPQKAECRAEKQRQRRGATSGQKTKRGICISSSHALALHKLSTEWNSPAPKYRGGGDQRMGRRKRTRPPPVSGGSTWPLQDIHSRQGFCARINHPYSFSHTCIAHTIAIRLHDFRTIYDPPRPPSFCMLYTIQYW